MMRRMAPAVAAAAMLTGAGAIGIACNGGGDGGGGGGGAALGDAQSLPADFPVYKGSNFTNGDDVPDGFVGVWQTTDDGAQVREFFDTQFKDGPWRIVDESQQGETTVIRVERGAGNGDEPETGVVVIRDDGPVTRIVKEITKKDPKRTPQPESTEPPNSDATPSDGSLPAGYPSARVPIPDGATITTASAPGSSGAEIFLIEFTTSSAPADVVAYYESALAAAGWTPSLKPDAVPGSFLLTQEDGADSVTVSGSGSDAGSTVSVTVVLAN